MTAKEITHEMFSPHLNSTFLIRVEGRAFELELTEVEVGERGSRPEEFRLPFVLIFKGPKDAVLPEGEYSVENDATGTLELYVIPIVSTGEQQAYQVVYG